MHKYIFILGRNQELSVAETKAVLNSGQFELEPGFLVYSSEKEIDADKLMNQLGGTIKIAKVFADKIDQDQIIEQILSNTQKGKKVYFGFSQYGQGQNINKIAHDIKKTIKEKGYPVRWVISKEKQLSSVVVKKNKLLSQGAEIIITKNHVAKTLAVQDFEEYGRRDFGRPARDTVSGTMPPKLAKIMINLTQVSQQAKILDPFCGSGTVLQEALVLGYNNVIGSDISQKAVDDTKENLEWLASQDRRDPLTSSKQDRIKELDLPTHRVGEALAPRRNDRAVAPDLPELYNFDVRLLSQNIKQVDAIITEPYLGPPLKGRETSSQISKIISDLEKLYLDAFAEFQKVLSQKGKIVIVFPIIDNQHLNILPQIKKLGFELQSPDNLIYSRPEQKVKRNILVFSKS
ncbi:RsmD family RNA methyltransferase [Patescibacteria group bacterium]|nr:RsmD family RNA methyltransferase [Patescibacteria group bacterium]